MALEMGIIEIEVYGDSKLIINQLLKIYEVKKDDLVLFFRQASHLLKSLKSVTLDHIPRKENKMTDALANLATTLALSEGETINIPVCNRWVLPSLDTFDPEHYNAITIATNDEEDWRTPLIEYLKQAVNGLAKVFNKTLCNLLKKVVSKSKRDWHEKIGEALWAYRTTHRNATQAMVSKPYFL
ncbi:UNVERIFIED_CONTAM: hypothetical protein Scaly_2653900 [Sesamum calycinum]|uniref:RNase H type-1 domain-containing protein n=1 Tax=Sesamum calycinum TaxID=2727403 RepID=A0AAW2JBH7_9LAMI